MDNTPRSSLLICAHIVLAIVTGAVICIFAGLLLCERPSELFDAGSWINNPASKYGLALLAAAFSFCAVLYLNHAALLSWRLRTGLVAAVPGILAAAWLYFGLQLLIHPIGF